MIDNKEDRIRESIDQIEPAAGAKERMLENIRRKAAAQAELPKETEIKTSQSAEISRVNEEKPKRAGKTAKSSGTAWLLRWALPIAACLCLLTLGVLKLLPGKKPDPVGVGTDVLTAGTYEQVPGEVTDISFGADGAEYTVVSFVYKGWDCVLYKLGPKEETPVFVELTQPSENEAFDGAVYCEVRRDQKKYQKLMWTEENLTDILLVPEQMKEDVLRGLYRELTK